MAAKLFGFLLCSGVLLAAGDQIPGDVDTLPVEQLVQVKVQTASLHEQSIESAPAAISVITGEEIRRYGYRTFTEILNHVRGFYTTYDYTYHNVGIAGFSIPGDWATRVLILLNGHPFNDNVFGSANAFGQDFIVDLSLIDRIEIVRGPSSALYGSNGILATINVITKKSEAGNHTTVRGETATPGDRILSVAQSLALGGRNSLLVSATAFNDLGQHAIPIPDLNTTAINMDCEKGYRYFANLNVGNWQIVAMGVSRQNPAA